MKTVENEDIEPVYHIAPPKDDDAEKFMSLGADRLGTSRIVKIVKNEAGSGY